MIYSKLKESTFNMGSSDLDFGLETGPDIGWADLAFSPRTGSNMGLTHPELGLRIWFLGPARKF